MGTDREKNGGFVHTVVLSKNDYIFGVVVKQKPDSNPKTLTYSHWERTNKLIVNKILKPMD